MLSTTGGPGSWYIEYGPTAARTERTPTRTIDFVVNESEPVSEPVDGLEPGATYHFAVCAEDSENPGDPFCSPYQTFKTPGDSVVGTGVRAVFEDITESFAYDIGSGTSGENPNGQFLYIFANTEASSEYRLALPSTATAPSSGSRPSIPFLLPSEATSTTS